MYLSKLILLLIATGTLVCLTLIAFFSGYLKQRLFRSYLHLKTFCGWVFKFPKLKLARFIKYTAMFLVKLSKLITKEESRTKMLYEDLSPSDHADEDAVYQKTLSWALGNPHVRNVALTGPYGSGKSSIIKTFQKKNTKFEYLNISLASFKEDEKDPKPNVLELNILYQIFYYAKPNNLGQSRFGRIEILSTRKIAIRVIGLFTLALAIAFLSRADYFNSVPGLSEIKQKVTINIIAWAVVCLGFLSIAYLAFKGYHSFRVGKLNIASAEMELGKKDKSVLNEHLDEILYFFEVSEYNVVFIEDLDRFENPVEIFTKLREINLLINNANRVRRNVVFVYALKDELFKDEKRTKFFDFIIPVIPVINSNNAKEMLSKKLKKAGLIAEIPASFISFIAYYVDDMRLLLNIINELILYKGILFKNFNLKKDKLFGMIIYKNLFPQDFSDLHEKKGMLHSIISNKSSYLDSVSKQLNAEIAVIQNKLKQIADERIHSLKELREIYIFRLFKFISARYKTDTAKSFTGSIDLDGTYYTLTELVDDQQLFEVLTDFKQLKYQYQHSYSTTWESIKFSFEELELDDEGYAVRKELVAVHEKQLLEPIKKELNQIQEKLRAHQEMDIKTIAKLTDLETIVPYLKENTVLSYLVRNGFLDENYSSYISLFHPGTLTVGDKDFLLSAQHGQSKSFQHALTNIQELIDTLSPFAFSRNYILNFDLLDFLLETSDKNQDQLNALLNQMISEQERAVNFLVKYIDAQRPVKNLLLKLSEVFPRFWDCLEKHAEFDIEKKRVYLQIFLKNLSTQDLCEFDALRSISNFIATDDQFLSWVHTNGLSGQTLDFLKQQDVKLENISYYPELMDLVDKIYVNNLYKLNVSNIAGLMQIYLPIGQYQNLKESHLTTLLSLDNEPIKEYIKQNMSEYISHTFLKLEQNFAESSHTLIMLLSDEIQLTTTLKTEIIMMQKRVFVEDIGRIDAELYPALLKGLTISPTYHNIQQYWSEYETDTPLIDYLNLAEVYDNLTGTWNEQDDEQFRTCFSSIILTPELSSAALKKILKSSGVKFANIDVSGLPEENVGLIIASGKMSLTAANFNYLQTRKKQETILMIEHFRRTFAKRSSEFNLATLDYYLILISDRLKDAEKVTLLAKIKPELMTKTLADTAIKLCLRETTGMNMSCLQSVISRCSLERERIELVNIYLHGFNKAQIQQTLTSLGKPYTNILKSKGHVELFATDYHRKFAELLNSNLKEGKFLSSVTPVKDQEKIRLNAKK